MSGILDAWGERSGRLSDDMSLLSEGEINPLQMALRTAGETGGAVGDVFAPVVDAVVPDFVKEGMSQIAQGVMDTGPAKYAAKWLEEHPEQARDLSSAFNAATLLPGLSATKGIKSAAHNMPNKLEGFYGSGVAGQAGAVAKGLPSTGAHMLKQAVDPRAQARMEGGVSSRLRSVAEENKGLLDEFGPRSPEGKSAQSFMEGQMDQSSLLAHGSGKGAQGLDDIFRPVQELGEAPMSDTAFGDLFTKYKPEQYEGLGVDQEMLSRMHKGVRDAQKIKPNEEVSMVLRHPTALTDLVTEGTSKGSRTGKRMYKARQLEQQLNPGKTQFDSVDDLKEFVAVRNLVDDRKIVRKDGRAMTAADRAEVKAFGPREGKYKQAESGNQNVTDYYKYKEMERSGKKLTKPQREKYEKLKGRIERGKEGIEIDSQGRAYFSDSHRSAAKGLGGVNDQFVVDMKGNVFQFINDENDLFGNKVPGDKRVVSVTPPTVYNVFGDKKNAPDTAGAAQRKAHMAGLEQQYGAPERGLGQMRGQMAEAITNYNPQVQARHVGAAAGNAGQLGLLGGLLTNPNEEQ